VKSDRQLVLSNLWAVIICVKQKTPFCSWRHCDYEQEDNVLPQEATTTTLFQRQNLAPEIYDRCFRSQVQRQRGAYECARVILLGDNANDNWTTGERWPHPAWYVWNSIKSASEHSRICHFLTKDQVRFCI